MQPVVGACDPLWARPDMESSEALHILIPAALLYIMCLFRLSRGSAIGDFEPRVGAAAVFIPEREIREDRRPGRNCIFILGVLS